jgi:hypothetical protein
MAPHHSTVKKFLVNEFLIVFVVGVFCILFCIGALTPAVLAQRAVSHGVGGAVHISASPVSHPISSAPIIHAPISAPRVSIGSFARGALGTARAPRRPIRPLPPVLLLYEPFFLGGPFSGLNSCWWSSCELFWPWLGYTEISSPGPTNYVAQVSEAPVYVYGEERPDLPQLFLKDGTILNVTDYWLVDDQLYFTMIDEETGKPAEHVIPFDALDLQKTVDVNTRRGFRFMLRNEPFEQYVRDHPEGPPPAVTFPHE